MGRNRMHDYLPPPDQGSPASSPPVQGRYFMVCPLACWVGLPLIHQLAVQALYAQALADAVAAARPSRVEKDLLGFWN